MKRRYRSRLSGPILDRIDIHIETKAVTTQEMMLGMNSNVRPSVPSTPQPMLYNTAITNGIVVRKIARTAVRNRVTISACLKIESLSSFV